MKKPFDVSELLRGLDEKETSQGNATHADPAGPGPNPFGAPGGNVDLQDRGGPTSQRIDSPQRIAEDPINPAHYRSHPSGIECIEVTRHMNFNLGNAIKYIWRHTDKGDPIENLKKAAWYLEDEIRRLQGLR